MKLEVDARVCVSAFQSGHTYMCSSFLNGYLHETEKGLSQDKSVMRCIEQEASYQAPSLCYTPRSKNKIRS